MAVNTVKIFNNDFTIIQYMDSTLVFLSSTVDDMQQERDAITEVLNSLQRNVSRCEFFPARTNSPEDVCLEEAKNCDVFIGIYKNRYGFIPTENNPDSFSVTELEYSEAKNANRPILLFYHETSDERDVKLKAFLDKIKNFSQGHYVKKFSNVEELKYLVLQSLVSHFKTLTKFTKDEKTTLETLVPQLTEYLKVMLKNLEYGDPKGIAKPTKLLKFRIKDLYVPPELALSDSKDTVKNDKSLYFKSLAMVPFGSSWEDIETLSKKKIELDNIITTGVNIIEKLQDKRPSIILGEAGSGKSTLMKYLSGSVILNTSIIPFYIQVRDFASFLEKNEDDSILDYLQKKYLDLKLDNSFFYNQLKSGSCLIVFDGLDEVWKSSQRNKVNEIIEQFCYTWEDQNKVIITSRFAGYEQNPLKGNLDILKIKPFGNKEIKQFVLNWANLLEESDVSHTDDSQITNTADDFLQQIAGDPQLTKLASSPIILNIICLSFMKNIPFPKRKHHLYSNLVETLLSTWEQMKGIEVGKMDWTEYLKILRKISFWMFDNNLSQINQLELYDLIKGHLNEEGISKEESDSPREIITNLEDRSGLIISDGQGNYSFYHLSFLEYFVALELTTTSKVEEIYNYFEPTLFHGKNNEIVSFVSSILSDKSRTLASDFLNYILETKSNWQEIHIMNLLLVLKSLSSGAVITNDFKNKVFQEIDNRWDERRLYDSTFFEELEGLISTPLEEDLINIWRKKCSKDVKNFLCKLNYVIVKKPEYIDDFIQFCEADITHDDIKFFSILDVAEILQDNRDTKLAKYILEHNNPEIFSRPDVIYGLALTCKNNEELKNLYFKTMEETNDNALKITMLECATIVDKSKATTFLNNLSIPTGSIVKDQLLGTVSLSQEERIKIRIQEFFKSSDPDHRGENVRLVHEIMSLGKYDQSIFDSFLKEFLKIPPNGSKLLVHNFVCVCIMFCEDYTEFIPFLKKFFSEHWNNCKHWESQLQPIILKLFQPKQNNKQLLLQTIKNTHENKQIRVFALKTFLDHFIDDKEIPDLISELIDDSDFQTWCLEYVYEHQDEFERNKQKIKDAYYTGPLENYFILPVDVIRKYIPMLTSN